MSTFKPLTKLVAYVLAVSIVGGLLFSSTARVRADAPTAPSEVAAAPIGNSNVVRMTWVDNSLDETKFQVGYYDWVWVTYDVPADITTYDFTTLSEIKTYSFRVRSCISTTCSAYVTVSNIPTGVKTPTDLVANPSSGQTRVSLSWKDPSNYDSNYYIERSEDPESSTFSHIAELPKNSVSYADSANLSFGKVYHYRVRFLANNGTYSEYSNVVDVNLQRDNTNMQLFESTFMDLKVKDLSYLSDPLYAQGNYYLSMRENSLTLFEINLNLGPVPKSSIELKDYNSDWHEPIITGDDRFIYVCYVDRPSLETKVHFYIMSIADPQKIRTVSYSSWNWVRPINYYPDYNPVQDIEVVGDKVYLAHERSGLYTIDVSDLSSSRVVDIFTDGKDPVTDQTTPNINSLYVYGDRLYARPFTFDISTTPITLLGKSVIDSYRFVHVENNTAYSKKLYTNEFFILDISNPNNFVVTDSFINPYTVEDIRVINGKITTLRCEQLADTSYNLIVEKYNLSDIHTVVETGTINIPNYFGTSFLYLDYLSNDRAYLRSSYVELTVDITDIQNMQKSEPGYGYRENPDIFVSYPHLYTVSRNPINFELSVYNIENNKHPRKVARKILYTYTTSTEYKNGRNQSIEKVGNNLFVTHNKKLQIVNIEEPLNPNLISSLDLSDAIKDMAISGNKIWATSQTYQTLREIDISNLDYPTLSATHNIFQNTSVRIQVSGNFAYVICSGSFQVIDLSTTPTIIATLAGYNFSYSDLAVSGNYVYIAKEMHIIDVSTPSAPVVVGKAFSKIDTTTYPNKLIISGERAHIIQFGGPVSYWQTMDISNPAAPHEIGIIQLPGNIVNSADALDKIAVYDRYAYLVSEKNYVNFLTVADLYYDRPKVTKEVDKTTVGREEELTYTLTITNPTPYNLTGLNLSDDVPLGATYVLGSASNGGQPSSDGKITWDLGSIPARQQGVDGKLEVSFKVRVN